MINVLSSGEKFACKILGLNDRVGGLMNEVSDINLIISSNNTPRIQEMHILLGHTLYQIIDNELSM